VSWGGFSTSISNRLNLGRIRREENILWSFAPHDISVILGLVGEMPEVIQTQGGNYLHDRIADVTLSLLSFPSGIKAHIFVSWLHPYKEQNWSSWAIGRWRSSTTWKSTTNSCSTPIPLSESTMSPYPAALKPNLFRLTPGSPCKRNARIFWNAYRPARHLAQTDRKDCAS